jgi:type IV pilus biogenesis protein CpaD/CtpE
MAASIETPEDLLAALASLPNDAERKRAIELLRPHLKFRVTTSL